MIPDTLVDANADAAAAAAVVAAVDVARVAASQVIEPDISRNTRSPPLHLKPSGLLTIFLETPGPDPSFCVL